MNQVKAMELPMPVSKNVWQRQHWAARSRTKKEWERQVWAWVNTPPRVRHHYGVLTVDLDAKWDKPGPLPDHHNLDMAHECIADGLVAAGILDDDAEGRYQRGSFQIQRVPKGQGKTVATIRDGC